MRRRPAPWRRFAAIQRRSLESLTCVAGRQSFELALRKRDATSKPDLQRMHRVGPHRRQ
jgi:hypothetical protein